MLTSSPLHCTTAGDAGGVTFTTQVRPRSFTTHPSCAAHSATVKASQLELQNAVSTPKAKSHSGYASFVQFAGGTELHFTQLPSGPVMGSTTQEPSTWTHPGRCSQLLSEAQVCSLGETGGDGVSFRTQAMPRSFTTHPSCAAHCATVKASQLELQEAVSMPKTKSQSG